MKREIRRKRPTVICGKTKTDQSQAESCDINYIMKKYLKTGQVTHLARNQGIYQDIADHPPDLLSAHIQLDRAQNAFNTLPSHIRERFQNNPFEMVKFLSDSKNIEEATSLGLLKSIDSKSEIKNDDKTTKNTPPKKSKNQTESDSPSSDT